MTESPQRFHLPSGRRVEISIVAERSPKSRPLSNPFADALAFFEESARLADDRGEPLSVTALRLDDFHTLRAIAAQLGWIPEEHVSVRCSNCEHRFQARPSSHLELGPFLDGELSDPELDAPFPFGEPLPIPDVALASGIADTVTFKERSVREAAALWEVLAREEGEIVPEMIACMGLSALGSEARPDVIATALLDASDEVLDEIFQIFDEAHYPPRLTVQVRCPACKAAQDVDAPAVREFPRDEECAPGDADSAGDFIDANAFEAKVRAIAARVYRQRGVSTAVGLVVNTDTPDVDDGGVPLLGSYLPHGVDPGTHIEHPPEVTLYYRSFRAMWLEEGPYDVDAEIEETVDHELEHHLHFLAGHDPLDDEERATLEDEAARIVGRREAVRRARAGFLQDIGEFFRRTWPLWVLVALMTVVATLATR